jgi:hypothetical protein
VPNNEHQLADLVWHGVRDQCGFNATTSGTEAVPKTSKCDGNADQQQNRRDELSHKWVQKFRMILGVAGFDFTGCYA